MFETMPPAEQHHRVSLLLIDDDAELCGMMKEFFAEAGCDLTCAFNGREGLGRALKSSYDLIVLDVMLPMIDGFTVLHQLRKRTAVPVIMLTARVHRRDRIQGLESGADDYLPKPFDPDELLARIRAVLRRAGRLEHNPGAIKKFHNITVDSQTREVWNEECLLDLTSLEFDLLSMLVSADGRIVTREEITAALLEREVSPYDRALDVHVSHLRRKLGNAGDMIRTVRGIGYVFAAKGTRE